MSTEENNKPNTLTHTTNLPTSTNTHPVSSRSSSANTIVPEPKSTGQGNNTKKQTLEDYFTSIGTLSQNTTSDPSTSSQNNSAAGRKSGNRNQPSSTGNKNVMQPEQHVSGKKRSLGRKFLNMFRKTNTHKSDQGKPSYKRNKPAELRTNKNTNPLVRKIRKKDYIIDVGDDFTLFNIPVKLIQNEPINNGDRPGYRIQITNLYNIPEEIYDNDKNLKLFKDFFIYTVLTYIYPKKNEYITSKYESFVEKMANKITTSGLSVIEPINTRLLTERSTFYLKKGKTLKDFTKWVNESNAIYNDMLNPTLFKVMKHGVGKTLKAGYNITARGVGTIARGVGSGITHTVRGIGRGIKRTAKAAAAVPLYPYLNTLYKNVYVMPDGAIYAFEKRFPAGKYKHGMAFFYGKNTEYKDDIDGINKISDEARKTQINILIGELDAELAKHKGFITKMIDYVSGKKANPEMQKLRNNTERASRDEQLAWNNSSHSMHSSGTTL